MTPYQKACCKEKLEAVSKPDADRFNSMMNEADQAAFKASCLRKETWDVYHQHFPSKKPPKGTPA